MPTLFKFLAVYTLFTCSGCYAMDQDFDDFIKQALSAFEVPGLSVGLVINDEIIFSSGFGLRSVAEEAPVTVDTIFPIASCSKAMTAFILNQLVKGDRISWDDPVIKYVPEFLLYDSDLSTAVTLRDLISHRTGLYRHDPLWVMTSITVSDALKRLRFLSPACGLREQFQYSNLMYMVAGLVIEKVTGQSFADAATSRLFAPLGMRSSGVSPALWKTMPEIALPYAKVKGKLTTLAFPRVSPTEAGGGVHSTIGDMTKWLRFAMNDLPEEMTTQQALITPSILYDEPLCINGYGLGWSLGTYRNHPLVCHSGDNFGFSSFIGFISHPRKKIGIVILTNSSTEGRYAISSIRNTLFDHFLGHRDTNWISKFIESHKSVKQQLQESLKNWEALKSSPNTKDYLGMYQHPAYGLIRLYEKNNELFLSYGDYTHLLKHKELDAFDMFASYLESINLNPIIECVFNRDDDSNISSIEVFFEKFRNHPPISFKRLESLQFVNCKDPNALKSY